MLELYNMTNDTKRVPKYNYNGKFVIKPHEAVDIPEDQAFFFKPYAKVGIVVRCKKDNIPRKPETVKVNQRASSSGMLDLGISSKIEEETYSSPSYEEPVTTQEPEVPQAKEVVEPVTEPVQETVVEETAPVEEVSVETKTWTEAELSEMSRDDLRAVARELGLDCDTVGRKKDIQEAILAKQGER